MLLITLAALFGVSLAQFVPQLPGFAMATFNGCNGFFNSHNGYLQGVFYPPGLNRRFVVTVPQGQKAQMTIDVTSPDTFKLRGYDFAVMYDGNSASQLVSPCTVNAYTALGPSGVSYTSITMSATSAVRTFVSTSNVVVLDLCVNSYNSGPNDPSMLGFRAFWSCGTQVPTPAPAPGPPTAPTQRPPAPPPAPAPPPVTASPLSTCGRPLNSPTLAQQNTRIVGGVLAPPVSWPWACALIHNGYQFCDCSILNSQWVITAGHCTAPPEFTEAMYKATVTVAYGSQNLHPSRGSLRNGVARMITHPQYDTPTGSTSHDVALVKLATPISNFPNVNAAPVCLPSKPLGSFPANQTGNFGRSLAYVAGWGTLTEGQTKATADIGSGSDDLLQTTIEMYSRQDCVNLFGSKFPDTTLCGGLNQGGRDSCQGDSGGPLVEIQPDGSFGLFGVVSFGQGCAEAGRPGAYSDVYTLSPWITQTMQSN